MPPAMLALQMPTHTSMGVLKGMSTRNSQRPGVGGSTTKPRLEILFQNTFAINQRFQLENIELLVRGEFYHDMLSGKIYVWPQAQLPGRCCVARQQWCGDGSATRDQRCIECHHT